MKKNLFICKQILLVSCFLMLNNCSGGIQETPDSLRPYSTSDLTFHVPLYSNTYSFSFYSTAAWNAVIAGQPEDGEIVPDPTVSPASGNGSSFLQTVYFTIPQNDSNGMRTFLLSIVSGERNLSVIIRQISDPGILSVDPAVIVFPSLGGTAKIKVSSNIDWTTLAADGWYTISPFRGAGDEDTYVTLSAPENGTAYRESSVFFSADNIVSRVELSQHAFHVTPPAVMMVSSKEPNALDFSILSTLHWKITCNAEWCSIETTAGAESDKLFNNRVFVETNSGGTRTAVIDVINSANEKKSFSITQAGDMGTLYDTQWSGTATVSAAGIITKTGSVTMTLVDENTVIVRGYPGQITYLDDHTIRFRVTIDSITYEGITGDNITAVFEGNFSSDYSRITGTLTGQGKVLGITINATGTWVVSR